MCQIVLICWLTDVLIEQQYRSISFDFLSLSVSTRTLTLTVLKRFLSCIWFLKKKRLQLKFETTSVVIVYVDFKTVKKTVYIKLGIKCSRKDSNVNFNLDVFMFPDSCCFNVGELQLAKWTKSIFFTIFFKKDKNTEKVKEISWGLL